MGTERFTLHRPGKHRDGHNVDYIAGEMVSDEGITRISLSMVGRDFENASHVIHMYPKTEE